MSTALERFCLMLSEVLSHMIVVEGCGYPMSESVVRREAVCCPVANRAGYSASPALATTQGIMEENTCMAPLMRVGSL